MLLASCSPLIVLNELGPDSAYRTVTSVPYGKEARQQLDIYQPIVSRDGIVVVFFTVAAGEPDKVTNTVSLRKL